jgi:hypothetical protein
MFALYKGLGCRCLHHTFFIRVCTQMHQSVLVLEWHVLFVSVSILNLFMR